MNPDSFVSPEMVELFNKAANLARNGEYAEAIKVYDRIFTEQKSDGKPYIISVRFAGIVYMRKSWALMDLKKYKEAREILEDKKMEAFFSQLEPKDLYDYYFSYGNILGNLGDYEKLNEVYEKLLQIVYDMKDEELLIQAHSLLSYYP